MRRTIVSLVLLVVLGALRAEAGIPDPVNNTVPPYVLLVGRVDHGATPDAYQVATVVVRDFANNPLVGAVVTLDFSSCCDLALCEAVANQGPATLTGMRVSGISDVHGRVDFIVMGAARDPGTITAPPAQFPGCGKNGVVVLGNSGGGDVVIGTSTAVCLDQNGAAGGSNGVSISDVANLYNLYGSIALGWPYRGRGDLNMDGNITVGDLGKLLTHLGRLTLAGGVGCTSPFQVGPACP